MHHHAIFHWFQLICCWDHDFSIFQGFVSRSMENPQHPFMLPKGDEWYQPQKCTSLHRKTSYEIQIVTIGPLVQPVHVTKKAKKDIKLTTAKWAFARPPMSDQNTIWHGGWSLGDSFQLHQIRLRGYQDVRDQNLHYPITMANGLHNSLYCKGNDWYAHNVVLLNSKQTCFAEIIYLVVSAKLLVMKIYAANRYNTNNSVQPNYNIVLLTALSSAYY